MKYGLIGTAGKPNYLSNATTNLFAVADDFFLLFYLSLEELAYVGEGVYFTFATACKWTVGKEILGDA